MSDLRPFDGWQTCRVGSCHRHQGCMYRSCRNTSPSPAPVGVQAAMDNPALAYAALMNCHDQLASARAEIERLKLDIGNIQSIVQAGVDRCHTLVKALRSISKQAKEVASDRHVANRGFWIGCADDADHALAAAGVRGK